MPCVIPGVRWEGSSIVVKSSSKKCLIGLETCAVVRSRRKKRPLIAVTQETPLKKKIEMYKCDNRHGVVFLPFFILFYSATSLEVKKKVQKAKGDEPKAQVFGGWRSIYIVFNIRIQVGRGDELITRNVSLLFFSLLPSLQWYSSSAIVEYPLIRCMQLGATAAVEEKSLCDSTQSSTGVGWRFCPSCFRPAELPACCRCMPVKRGDAFCISTVDSWCYSSFLTNFSIEAAPAAATLPSIAWKSNHNGPRRWGRKEEKKI